MLCSEILENHKQKLWLPILLGVPPGKAPEMKLQWQPIITNCSPAARTCGQAAGAMQPSYKSPNCAFYGVCFLKFLTPITFWETTFSYSQKIANLPTINQSFASSWIELHPKQVIQAADNFKLFEELLMEFHTLRTLISAMYWIIALPNWYVEAIPANMTVLGDMS